MGNATQKINELNDDLNGNKIVYEQICGGGAGSLDNLTSTLKSTSQVFEDVEEIGQNTTNLLKCEDINRIWVDLSHDAFCTSSPYALGYMFGTMTAIYIVGMLIFLMRGAMLPETVALDWKVEKNDDMGDERRQFADDHDEEERNEITEPLNKDTNKDTNKNANKDTKDVVLY